MNYRHIYHAGNFADIFKHLITLMVLDYLQQKDKGIFVLDAFAGLGLYDLQSPEAQRTQEYAAGSEAFMAQKFQNPDLQKFQDKISSYWQNRQYPGSPLLLAEQLRPQDRLLANELHPQDNDTLQANLLFYPQAKITRLDAYQSLRANLPPPEKRGLVLIDPPFERTDEFAVLAAQMQEWHKRFAIGTYIIWYPIKADGRENLLFDAAYDLKFNRSCIFECLLRNRKTPDGLNGCGLLILNTPFQIPERIEALADELAALWPGSKIENRYLLA